MISPSTENPGARPLILLEDTPSNRVLSLLLDDLKYYFDDNIGRPVFVPVMREMLRDCNLLSWESDGNNTYKMTLDSCYQAAKKDNSGKTWYFEKEILLQFNPEEKQIIFPKVMDFFRNGMDVDFRNKNLNAIWAWEKHLWSTFTGVGYSMRWEEKTGEIVSDNINDAPAFLQSLATPRRRTIEQSLADWRELDRKKAASPAVHR